MRTLSVLLMVFGVGFAWGGLLGTWRYRLALGATTLRFFKMSVRYGVLVAVVGAILFGLTAVFG